MRTTRLLSGGNRQVCAIAPQHPRVHVNPLVGAHAFSDYVSDYETGRTLQGCWQQMARPPILPLLMLHYTSHVRFLSPSFLPVCAPRHFRPLSRSISLARARVKFTNPYGALLASLTSDSLRLSRAFHLRNRRSSRLPICMLLFGLTDQHRHRDPVNFSPFAERALCILLPEIDQFRVFPFFPFPSLSLPPLRFLRIVY